MILVLLGCEFGAFGFGMSYLGWYKTEFLRELLVLGSFLFGFGVLGTLVFALLILFSV